MANAKIQTVKNKASVASFIAAVDDETRRKDAKALAKLMAEETGEKATMWGPAIIGFGEYHYKYDSGREGDMPKSAFSPRKQGLVLYVGAKDYAPLLKKLGKHKLSGDARYHVDPEVAILPIDALGFRRGAGALKTLLSDQGLQDEPLFAQAKLRGIKALSGHAESIDVTNDVNGGPSGVGIAAAAGKAAFWDMVGAHDTPKVVAFEGEFAMT